MAAVERNLRVEVVGKVRIGDERRCWRRHRDIDRDALVASHAVASIWMGLSAQPQVSRLQMSIVGFSAVTVGNALLTMSSKRLMH